jgi:polyhydroxyalkanoate synthesis regulator phasin
VDLPKKAAEVQSFVDKATTQGRATYNQAKEMGSELWGETEKKMDQVADYARQKRPEVADSILTELEKHKSSLPQSMQDRLVSLRKQVDADKAATRPDSQ